MRVAVVIDPSTFDLTMYEHLQEIINSPRDEITLVITDNYGLGEAPDFKFHQKFIIKPAIKLINATAEILTAIRRGDFNAFVKRLENRSNLLDRFLQMCDCEQIEERPHRVNRYRFSYSSETVRRVRESSDVIFLAGAGRILTGDILECVEHGVLSFHPADTNSYKGRPGGFYEWINNEKMLGITLQKLSRQLDGGAVVLVESIDLFAEPSWSSAMRSLNQKRRGMLYRGLRSIEHNSNHAPPRDTAVNTEKKAYTFENLFRFFARHFKSPD